MDKKVGFSYGVITKSLEEQANEQGYTLGDDADRLEKILKAINMCGFHVATPSQINSMTMKLHNQVIKALKPI